MFNKLPLSHWENKKYKIEKYKKAFSKDVDENNFDSKNLNKWKEAISEAQEYLNQKPDSNHKQEHQSYLDQEKDYEKQARYHINGIHRAYEHTVIGEFAKTVTDMRKISGLF